MNKEQTATKKQAFRYDSSTVYDLIIVGAGPAGISAAIFAIERGLRILVLEEAVLCANLHNIPLLDEVPCIFKKSAMNNELPFIFTEQLAKNKIEVVYAKVLNIENTSMQIKKVSTSLQVYYGKYVILATGIKNSSVQTAINTEKYYGRGLSFCAPCDVIYYLRKNVAVTGNNEYGAKIALYLSEFVNEVHYVISDSFLVASKVVIQNIMANKKIQVYYGSTLSKVNGELAIESADIIHQKTGIQLKLEIVAWFCYDRFQGNIDFVKAGVIGDNYIGTSYNMETNIPGIYAVGAVRESGIKRLVYCFSDALTAVNEIDHNLYFQK